MEDLIAKFGKKIDMSKQILIISHRKPDADTLGAALCLKIWLVDRGCDVTLACVDKPSKVFSFLPSVEEYVDNFELNDFDLVIIVDAGASYMTNFHLVYEDLFKGIVPIVNIDHHASNDFFGEINIVDVNAASATVIVHKILTGLGVAINPDMATCLLAGIYGDTGGFMHSNTNDEVYKIAAELMKYGARVKDIVQALFGSRTINTLRLWGKVLEKTHITEDGVVVSVVKEEDYDLAEASPEQLSGVIDYLNMVPDTKFAVLINEDRKGNVKGSLRTRNDDVDLSRIAAVFGGGGHPKASGFMLPGKLNEKIDYQIVSQDMSKKSLNF